MTEFGNTNGSNHLARRHGAERRFRAYGLSALILTTAFLGVLLFDIVWRAIPAFTQHLSLIHI